MKVNVKDIVYLITLLAVISLFINDCSNKSSVESKTVSISDTVWNVTERDTVIYNTLRKDTTIYNPEVVNVQNPVAADKDSLRTYFGVKDIDVGTITWTANVSGFLEDINFSSKLNIPERIVYRDQIGTVTKTVEITRTPRWNLYAGAHGIISNDHFDIGPQIQLRIGNINYNYSYGVVNQTHSAGIGVKIW